jgi:hypothetical protein
MEWNAPNKWPPLKKLFFAPIATFLRPRYLWGRETSALAGRNGKTFSRQGAKDAKGF